MNDAASNQPPPVTKTTGFNYWTLLSRVVVGVLLSASLWLIWWSYYRVFFPSLKQTSELDATVAKLNTQVEALNQRWSAADIARINQEAQTVQSNLFADQDELKYWLVDLQERTAPLSLDIKADYAKASEKTGAGLEFLEIPTTISVGFKPFAGSAAGASPYQRLLQFAQDITTQEKADCLAGLTVESGINSINHAALDFNFWVGTKKAK